MPLLISEIARILGARLVGEGAAEISGIASIESATASQIVFVEDQQRLEQALGAKAGAIIAGDFAEASLRNSRSRVPVLLAPHPRLAFAHAARLLHPPRRQASGIHSSAVVHHSAKVGKHVSLGPNVVLGEDCTLGERTRIGPGSCIGTGAVIGADCFIDTNVTIYSGTRIGDHVGIHAGAVVGSPGFGYVFDAASEAYEQFPQIGDVVIGDHVEIGANVTIDRGALDSTVIGSGTKIDNLVHIGHNVRIGKNVVIAAQTGISGSSVIADHVVVGGQVGIADHVQVQEGVILGAKCGVPSRKIVRGKGSVYWGLPARPLRDYLKEMAALAKLAKTEKET